MTRHSGQLRGHAGLCQAGFECTALLILPGKAGERHTSSKPGNVHRDVGGSARLFTAVRHPHHGYWGLGRNALHIAPDVAVQHDVANHEHARFPPVSLDTAHNLVQVFDHALTRSCRYPRADTRLIRPSRITYGRTGCALPARAPYPLSARISARRRCRPSCRRPAR